MGLTKSRSSSIDGGWAWVVLVAHCAGFMFLCLHYANGIFNAAFLEIYNYDKATTAWVGSVQSGLHLLLGPLSGYMNEHLSARWTIVIGGAITTLGLFLTAFATSFHYVFISYGVIAGIGFGILYIPIMVTVGTYFDKYRNLAYGFISMGVGVSYMTLIPLVEYVYNQYNWRIAMMFMAACTIQMLVIGALTRPLETLAEIDLDPGGPNKTQLALDGTNNEKLGPKVNQFGGNDDSSSRLNSNPNMHHEAHDINKTDYIVSPLDEKLPIDSGHSTKNQCVDKFIANGTKSDSMDLHLNKLQGTNGICNGQNSKHLFTSSLTHLHSHNGSSHTLKGETMPTFGSSHVLKGETANKSDAAPLMHLNGLPGRLVNSKSHQKSLVSVIESLGSLQPEFGSTISVTKHGIDPNINNIFITEKDITKQRGISHPFHILYLLNSLLYNLGGAIYFLHFPAFVKFQGTSSFHLSIILSCYGAGTVFSRLVTGIIAYQPGVNIFLLGSVSQCLAGLVLLFAPYIGATFSGQMCVAIFYSLLGNIHVPLLVPTNMKILRTTDVSRATGVQAFMFGIGYLLGPPLAGLFFDLHGSYTPSLISAGALSVVAALVMAPTIVKFPCCKYDLP